MTDLDGRHALVCGASRGIGRATAVALAARGAVVTALARDEEMLVSLLPELTQAGAPDAHALVADLEDRADVTRKVVGHIGAHGPIHILVNNAGGPPGGRLLDVDDEAAFLLPFGRHVLASHALVRACLSGMEEAAWGRIVNIISTSVREPIPGLGVSNTVRGAMAAWAKTLSRELPPGITVNSVLPGATDTDRLRTLSAAKAEREGKTQEEVFEEWRSATPEGRLAQPEEVAAAVAWLCSGEASFVRGVVLPVDGGRLQGI